MRKLPYPPDCVPSFPFTRTVDQLEHEDHQLVHQKANVGHHQVQHEGHVDHQQAQPDCYEDHKEAARDQSSTEGNKGHELEDGGGHLSPEDPENYTTEVR